MSRLIKRRDVQVAPGPALAPVAPPRVLPRASVRLGGPALIDGAAALQLASAVEVPVEAPPSPELPPSPADPAESAAEAAVALVQPAPAPERSADETDTKAADAARASADRIIEAAQSRAELIIDEALAGADKLAEEARAAGYEAGREEGLAAAAAEIEDMRQQLAAERDEIEEQRRQIAEEQERLAAERLEAQAERERLQAEAEMAAHRLRHEAVESAEQLIAATQAEVLDLALAVAKRIVQREIERDQEALIGMLAGALQRVRGAGEVTVRVSPNGVAVLAQAEETLDRTALGIDSVTAVADPSLGPGDLIVETNNGTVDARVDEQLALLRQSLGEVLGHDER